MAKILSICWRGGDCLRVEQKIWQESGGWHDESPRTEGFLPQVVLVFGTRKCLKQNERFAEIKGFYPGAHIFGCSTAGEICGTRVCDTVVTALEFEHTRIEGMQIKLNQVENALQAGEYIAASLPVKDLSHVLILSDGLKVNGSDLVRGLTSGLPSGISITGGLAADGGYFEETLVFWDALPEPDTIAILGFYGNRLKIGYGSMGGWDPFGPERLITRSVGNILYEMDGRSALELYKKYLGEFADGLPTTGVFFPLSIRNHEGARSVVRAILAVNEEDQSLTFAGNVPTGAYARLMKANSGRLIEGAIYAAQTSLTAGKGSFPAFALIISCFARRVVLGQMTEEEIEEVAEIMGSETVLAGFYSYGEISPFSIGEVAELHNQTMTITTFWED